MEFEYLNTKPKVPKLDKKLIPKLKKKHPKYFRKQMSEIRKGRL